MTEHTQFQCKLKTGPVQVKVQALDFSPDGRFLLSLGGQDDGSLVSNCTLLHLEHYRH